MRIDCAVSKNNPRGAPGIEWVDGIDVDETEYDGVPHLVIESVAIDDTVWLDVGSVEVLRDRLNRFLKEHGGAV